MEIKTSWDIRKEIIKPKTTNRKWVALDKEVVEALIFFRHLKDHKEVKEAPEFAGIPMCKICGKPSTVIALEECLKKEAEDLKFERCPNDCKKNREEFVEGSRQRKGIFHDTIGQCALCGKIITEEELK